MWTKNGANILPLVLKQISEVIPPEFINKRVIVDDQSTDNTREIAKSFGWDVVSNEGKGISDATNTALKHVTSEYFISFEQDLLLARDWWQKIPQHLSDPEVAIASGLRLPNQPLALREIEEYAIERYKRREKDIESFLCGKTLDNTIYKTKVMRQIGGFPKLSISAGVDNVLALRVNLNQFKWKVDYTVKSIHLRKGLRDELAHYYWYGTCSDTLGPLLFKRYANMRPLILRLFFSPLRGLHIAIKKKAPQAVYIYPLIRFVGFKGIFDGRRRYTFFKR
jgi:glycosyltransferase involved in cell wall biosynthesis